MNDLTVLSLVLFVLLKCLPCLKHDVFVETLMAFSHPLIIVIVNLFKLSCLIVILVLLSEDLPLQSDGTLILVLSPPMRWHIGTQLSEHI